MKLLLSAHALRTWGPRMAAFLPALDFVTAGEVVASGRTVDADIAFVTR